MKNLFDDALSLLGDRYIDEAISYTPEVKTIRMKKIFSIAACLVLAVVSAFAVKGYISPYIMPTEPTATNSSIILPEYNSTTVAGHTDESTTVANAPEWTASPTTSSAGKIDIQLYCTTPAEDYTGWENHSFSSYYHEINIDEAYYCAEQPLSASRQSLSKEDLGDLLYEFIWNDYRFAVDGIGDFTVQVYELKGWSKEKAVAVGRKDGLMKGCYAYYRASGYAENLSADALAGCQTLSDIIDFADITEVYNPDSFCTSFWVYYKEADKEDIVYSISAQTMEKLASFIINNRDLKAEERISKTGEKLTFNAYFKRKNCELYFCNDGYLYLYSDGLTRAFNLGVESYEKFMNNFKQGSVVWTPENPVTMG